MEMNPDPLASPFKFYKAKICTGNMENSERKKKKKKHKERKVNMNQQISFKILCSVKIIRVKSNKTFNIK